MLKNQTATLKVITLLSLILNLRVSQIALIFRTSNQFSKELQCEEFTIPFIYITFFSILS